MNSFKAEMVVYSKMILFLVVNMMSAAGGLGFNRMLSLFENSIVKLVNELLDFIVDFTNKKARSVNANFVINRNELNTFIGVGI